MKDKQKEMKRRMTIAMNKEILSQIGGYSRSANEDSESNSLINQTAKLAQNTLKQVENVTYKSKYVEGVAKNSKEMIDNILKSDDPLYELGPGISSFHRLLMMLFILFFCLCMLHLPILRNFCSTDFYDVADGWIVRTSLGNLGFSSTKC